MNNILKTMMKKLLGVFKINLFIFLVLPLIFQSFSFSIPQAKAAVLLSDDFTGTDIDPVKWVEYDAAGAGGTAGNIQQNGSLSVNLSNNGTTALVSVDSFVATNLEISSVITTTNGKFILGYGDREWSLAGHRAYLLYNSGSNILGLAWNNGALKNNVACGTMTSGATYKMKVIATGFEVYKNAVLQCTVTPITADLVDTYPIFLESNDAISYFDDILVDGTAPDEITVPAAPTIGTATVGDTEVSVSFTPGASGGSPITGYTATSNPGSITASGASSPITVTGLTNGVAYTFTVTATNAIGTSDPSAASNAVTPREVTILDQADLWLEADAIVGLNDGDAVTTWSDSSVYGLDATQATADYKPVYKTNIVNSQPVVRFDGNNDVLTTASTASAAGITVFTVIKNTDTSSGYLASFGGNNNAIIGGYVGTLWEYYSSPRTTLGNISTSEFQIITSRVGSGLTGVVSLGADAGRIAPWAGDVAEFIYYKAVLSDTDYNYVYDYLNDKYFAVVDPVEPDAPTELAATPASEQMLLSWTAPASDGGAAITDYLVEYKLSSEPTTWTTFSDGVSTATTATVTGLTNNLSYDFRVSATNSVGTGLASDAVTETPALSIPSAPTSLSATGGNNQSSLTWTAPASDGGAAITDYLVEYKLNSEPTTWTTFSDGVSTATTATVTGLTNNLSYDFRVSATNSVGTGPVSNTATALVEYVLLSDDFSGTTILTNKWAETDTGGAGGTVGNVQQNGSLTVANSESGTDEGVNALVSVDSFDNDGLEISAKLTSNGGLTIFGYGDRQWNLVDNKAYFIYISGATIMGLTWHYGSYTNSDTNCSTYTAGATYAMKIITTGFEVYKDDVLQCTVTPGDGNLVNNKPIFLESNGVTASTFDDIYVIGTYTEPTAPDAPTIGTATADNAQATVTFTPGASGGSPITGYTVTSNPGSITATGSASPITVTGLTNDVEYTFTVTATNAIGTSAASAASNAVTPTVPTVPDQVTGLEAHGYNQQALLSWTAPDNGGAPISDYLLEYKPSATSTWSTFVHEASTALKAIVTGLVNDTQYDLRVSAVNSGGAGLASATATSTPRALTELVIVINGESNSGGQANNSEATAEELAPTSEVQILNNTSFVFEDLDIGTNNNIDHCCWLYSATDHGFELQLASSTKANAFPDNPAVHLIKTGQGGSRLSQWNVGGTYWNKFLERTAAAKTQLSGNPQWVTWISIGINDYLAGTTVANFKTQLIDHIDKIKVELPGTIVILTQFQSMGNGGYATYNTAMGEIADTEPNVFVVDSTGADNDDGNHWSYDGLKTVGARMVTISNTQLGLIYPGLATDLSATVSNATQVDLDWTAPVANGGAAISDYLVEYKISSASSWTTFTEGVSTDTATSITGLVENTNYDFRVSTLNSNGTGNATSTSAITGDATAPTISSVLATPTDTTSSITWTTNEAASSIVDLGFNTSYASSTTETDTDTRVTNHTVNLTNLLACTTYHFRVKSKDTALNLATGTDNNFTTIGCSGDATVEETTNETVATSTGAIVNLATGTANLSLNIPPGFDEDGASDVDFQINQLNAEAVVLSLGTPTSLAVIGAHTYDLSAFIDIETTLDTFDAPLTLTINYTDEEISGMDESSLTMYYWNGTSWEALTDCTVETETNALTCTTTHFSTFAVFGEATAASTPSQGGGGATIIPSQGQGQADIHIEMHKAKSGITLNSQGVNLLMYINSELNFSLNNNSAYKLIIKDLDMLNSQVQIELADQILNLKPTQFALIDLNHNQIDDLKLNFNTLLNNRLDLTLTFLTSSDLIKSASYNILVKEKNKPAVYLLDANFKRLIPNETIFLAHGFKWSDVKVYDSLSEYALGETLTYPEHNFSDGALVKEKNSPVVYLLEDHQKRLILNESIFLSYNFKWSDIIEIDSLSSYPQGQELESKVSTAQTSFTRTLNLNTQGQDVRLLQTILSQDKEVYPEAKVTGFFGPLTKQAVQRFQLKYQIVNSPNDAGYGIVGPRTREKLNEG